MKIRINWYMQMHIWYIAPAQMFQTKLKNTHTQYKLEAMQ